MKPWGRFLFIFVAYSIALLHTGVPHHHGQITPGQPAFIHAGCYFTHGSSGGLLQKVFSTDLGVGHLENFKKNSDTQVEFSRAIAFLISACPVVVRTADSDVIPAFFGGYIEQFKRQLLLRSVRLFRAPPAFA